MTPDPATLDELVRRLTRKPAESQNALRIAETAVAWAQTSLM